MSRIDWLVCTTDPAALSAGSAAEVPASDIEVAAEGCLEVEAGSSLRLLSFLSPSEREILTSLRFPKRRREWLLGRWTAKQLLQRARPEYTNLPLTAIAVANDPDGAPYLSVTGEGRLPLSLSISHRNDRAFCALLSPSPVLPAGQAKASVANAVGADMEHVYPRDSAFVRDYFTATEAEHVWRCPDGLRDTLVTVLWSAKEAVLKVLRLGLTVDTRSVELRHIAGLKAAVDPTYQATVHTRWARIQVVCTLPATPPLCAWWRPHASYVLTLAAFSHPGDSPYPCDVSV